ncbi:hypothetical protein DL96DRAFT_1609805 [Flagelloscypha sp. PMI_526]|nr:hypothetical protein DL96DRAFT_1609805 [Flagelloscypha sp. PMI_526]
MPPLWSHLQTDDMKHERNQELGRLTDIFRIARYVCVFCEDFGCDHTGVTCVWGQRVWTLAEIVHASTVLQMSAVRVNSSCWEWDLREIEGRLFKGSMKGHAEREQRWHLQAVMEHATNAGSTSWQKTIQALVIEVIHRSDTTGYGYKGRKTYTQLGRALNGLLPRRADPRCFSETNGWADLAMLLELNQGFYNTAALAAVCPVAHDTEDLHRWLAKPIAPKPGQERLEPLITAFPVTDPSSHTSLTPEQRKGIPLTMSSKTFENSGLNTALCLVNPSVIELAPSFVRNGSMIYSKEMKPVRLTAMGISILLAAVGGLLIYFGYSTGTSGSNGSSPPDNNESPNSSDDGSSTSDNDPSSTFGINGMFISGILLIWLGACAYALVRLVLGTMCVNMEGWVCWDEPDDVGDVDKIHFSRRRSQFRTWDADHNLAPEFPLPDNMPSRNIVIFDLKHRVRVSVQIPLAAKKPSYMIPIALHGSGITCMLIADQEEDSEEDDDDDVIEDYVWAKVGMIHLPTYILAEAKAVRTLLVGGRRPKPRVEWS